MLHVVQIYMKLKKKIKIAQLQIFIRNASYLNS